RTKPRGSSYKSTTDRSLDLQLIEVLLQVESIDLRPKRVDMAVEQPSGAANVSARALKCARDATTILERFGRQLSPGREPSEIGFTRGLATRRLSNRGQSAIHVRVVELTAVASAHDQTALDHVEELTNISGPFVVER